jgi:opacity protein-like surface antigen
MYNDSATKIRKFGLILLATLATGAQASKDGLYLGIGLTSTTYRSNASGSFVRVIDDQRVSGWRGEAGYIWDIGKPGGFQLGVAGAYDDLGRASDTGEFQGDTTDVRLEASTWTAYFVIDQEIESWVDFIFKVGPSLVDYDVNVCCSEDGSNLDKRQVKPGFTSAAGFAFFPTQNIAIEVAGQFTTWLTGDRDDFRDVDFEDNEEIKEAILDFLDSRVTSLTWTASFQYRF